MQQPTSSMTTNDTTSLGCFSIISLSTRLSRVSVPRTSFSAVVLTLMSLRTNLSKNKMHHHASSQAHHLFFTAVILVFMASFPPKLCLLCGIIFFSTLQFNSELHIIFCNSIKTVFVVPKTLTARISRVFMNVLDESSHMQCITLKVVKVSCGSSHSLDRGQQLSKH